MDNCIFLVYIASLPKTLPAPLHKGHSSQFPLVILLNTTLLPVLALLINFLLPTDKVRTLRANNLGLLDNLPSNEQEDGISVAKVASNKALGTPRLELVETDKDEGNSTQEQANVCSIWVERRNVVQSRVIEALSLASTVPADEDDDHHGVCGDETGGGQVDEPEEDSDGGFAGDKEGDAAEETDNEDSVHGDTRFIALHEESGGLTVAGETVESSRGGVKVGVTARETGSEDEEVDEIGEAADTKVLNY